MDTGDFIFQAKAMEEGYYITSDGLPGFRLFIGLEDVGDIDAIIKDALGEFLPMYQAAEARQRVRAMSFERQNLSHRNEKSDDFEILGHVVTA
jgi:hypothetical protein